MAGSLAVVFLHCWGPHPAVGVSQVCRRLCLPAVLLSICPVCPCPFIPDHSFMCPFCPQHSAGAVGGTQDKVSSHRALSEAEDFPGWRRMCRPDSAKNKTKPKPLGPTTALPQALWSSLVLGDAACHAWVSCLEGIAPKLTCRKVVSSRGSLSTSQE